MLRNNLLDLVWAKEGLGSGDDRIEATNMADITTQVLCLNLILNQMILIKQFSLFNLVLVLDILRSRDRPHSISHTFSSKISTF